MFYKYTLLTICSLFAGMAGISAKHLLTSDKAMATNNVSAINIMENQNNKVKPRAATTATTKIVPNNPPKKDKK
ncbi:hypothetical protein [Taibaiella sp. KBW10]|uniref:hypothetical protein n=1 Tax=Taibaiella sp. KBW10 TaxID=2153357 RepID=UPI000F5A5C14|nr:hypothetical protein [Taibaiella sp. KBW10]